MNSKLKEFYHLYNESFKSIEQNESFSTDFYNTFLSGETTISQKYLAENKTFDEEWIKTVESYIPSLNKIVNNPKSTIKMEEEIVQIEKARNINSQSIRHLSANTHFIRDIGPDGMVQPNKILTSFADVDYGTYENRFIMTLIDRLFVFVRNRYDVIKRNIDELEMRELTLKSNFPINDSKIELDLKLTFKDVVQNENVILYNKKLLERIEYLNKVVTSLKASDFMEKMTGQRKIHPPIMRTNVITKAVDYRNSYMLWLFLDRYNTLAFKIEVREKDLTFTDEYFKDIHRQVLTLYSTVVYNQEMNKETYEQIKPKKHHKNSIKVIKRRPDEFLLDYEDEMIEDQSLNEYYLNQNKKIFQQSIDYHQNDVKTYETALKRALRDTLNISNALYESFFELEEEDDIFRKLITEVDVTEELKESRRKVLISKMIREVKAVDYNDSLRRERTFLNEIIKFDGILLKEYKSKLEISKEDLREIKRLEEDRKQAKIKLDFTTKELRRVRESQDEINAYRILTNKKINDYQRELNEKLVKDLSLYSKELDNEYKLEVKKLEEQHKLKLVVTKEDLKREQLLLDNKLKVEKLKIDEAYRIKLAEQKSMSRNEMQLLILRKSNELAKREEENLENIERLKEINEKYISDLEKYKKSKQ